MKLSEKFARQETEQTRLARIARRRISEDRADSVRRLFGIDKDSAPSAVGAHATQRSQICDVCQRRFSLPMHLGRHKKSKHPTVAL
jgi:hypothetical protein